MGAGAPARFKTAAGGREPPGGGDPEAGSSATAFRAAAGGVNVRTEQPNARPQPLGNPSGVSMTERPVARPQQPVDSRGGCASSMPEMPRPEARPQRPVVAPRVAEPVRPEDLGATSAAGQPE